MAERRAMLRMQFLLHADVILTRVLVPGAGLGDYHLRDRPTAKVQPMPPVGFT
jgi:hypothetical protein